MISGVISGLAGAFGTLGGVVFSGITRAYGFDFHRTLWIMGIWVLITHALTVWVRPISKRQLGGR